MGSEQEREVARRAVLRWGVVGAALVAAGGVGRASRAAAAGTRSAPETSCAALPYGRLSATPDANGFLLPAGFTTRVLARSGDVVPGTGYTWHPSPDGGATFPAPDGGWVYVSNSEIPFRGGVGALRFDGAGAVVGAYRLLSQTTRNCSGGPTPWGTWLSCEEVDRGRVVEVDPFGVRPPVVRKRLGRFPHEAAAVDPVRRHVYLTEDMPDGLLYRYSYRAEADLSRGRLDAAVVAADGSVTWSPVPDPAAETGPTRYQVPAAKRFRGAEGVWYQDGIVNFATKEDNRIWAYRPGSQLLSVVYDRGDACDPVLNGVDNITVAPWGDLYVCEDHAGACDLCVVTRRGEVTRFLTLTGQDDTELTGVAFAPGGDRLYLSSQRGVDGRGITYEVRGPFSR